MIEGSNKVAELAASFMDSLEEQYGADAEIVDAMVIVEIHVDGGDDERGMHVDTNCTNNRPTVQSGLLNWAIDTVEHGD